jgi:hypothetical protein
MSIHFREARARLWTTQTSWFVGLLAIVACSAQPTEARAQDSEIGIYHQTLFAERDHRRSIESGDYIQAFVYAAKSAGGWGFAYREAGYLSATVGPFYDITDWLEAGLAFGAEAVKTGRTSPAVFGRIAGILWIGNDNASVTVYYENGASKEPWHQFDATWHPAEWWGIGILSQSNAGTGPRISVRTPRLPIEIWVAPMLYELPSHRFNLMLGAQYVKSWKRK